MPQFGQAPVTEDIWSVGCILMELYTGVGLGETRWTIRLDTQDCYVLGSYGFDFA